MERVLNALLSLLPNDLCAFKNRCATITEWCRLLDLAGRHGLDGVVLHYLAEARCDLSREVLHQAKQQIAFERLALARLSNTLHDALAALASASVQTVVLKGPVLAERLYPDPWLRPSSDLDLLVLPSSLNAATEALSGLGYQPETGPSARYYRQHHHHVHFYHAHAPPLELHFRMLAGFGRVVRAEEFIGRAIPYRTRTGAATWVLSPEDEFLYLCLHAAGHRLERLGWLYDLKMLVIRCPEIDWSRVAAQAEALGVRAPVLFVCETLRHRLQVPIPPRQGVSATWNLRSRVATALMTAATKRPPASSLGKLAGLGSEAVLCERLAGALWLARHHLLRVAKRRAHRYLPRLVPAAWSA